MKRILAGLVLLLMCCWLAQAQQAASTITGSSVPSLINYSGVLKDDAGKTLTSATAVTFLIYTDEQGGSPAWMETQNVKPDGTGRYTVQLGSTSASGLPTDLFQSGEARWLAIEIAGEQEQQPRVLLVAVPYAMKAADAQTLGGLPASAFLLAASANIAASSSDAANSGVTPASVPPPASSDVTTTGGTINAIPLFGTATSIKNSILTQTGTTAINVKGALSSPALGTATSSAGFKSQPQDFVASSFNSSTSSAENQTFQWQAEPAANNTANPAGTLNLLYGLGTTAPSETGLNIASTGIITFASGQTFPGTGNGTITGITAGTGLSGSGTSGNITLNNTGLLSLTSGTGITVASGQNPSVAINPSVVPQLAAANTFTGNQTVNGNLSATGAVTGSSFQIGSNLFDYGAYANGNAFTGFAGNTTMTAGGNTAAGVQALFSNTAGNDNTAIGLAALYNNTSEFNSAVGAFALNANTSGSGNTAAGDVALFGNTTGGFNTAIGSQALFLNTTASGNVGVGHWAGYTADKTDMTANNNTFLGTSAYASTGTLTNATAIGANSEVAESNALVLGSINGVNGATASTNVGIGTTTPAYALDVHGTGSFTGLITFASGQTFPGTGTITGVTAGTGLSGSGTSGNVTLNNTGILALTAGTGLSSTGGQSPTLSINTSLIPEISTANTFTANLSTTGELAAGAAPSGNIASGTVEVDAAGANKGTYAPGLNFGGGGQSIASDRAGTLNVKGIDFYTNFINRMSLTNGGDLGIGTTAPTHLFEVDAAATTAQMAMVSSGTDAAISVKNTASGGREYWIDSGSGAAGIGPGNFGVYDATAGSTRLVINSSGNVGINTTSPIDPLDVESSSTPSSIYGRSSYDSDYSAAVVGVETGATQANIGVWGSASGTYGIGSYSVGYSASGLDSEVGAAAIGSWADTGAEGGYAVFATANGGASIYGLNDSSTYSTSYWQNLANSPGALVFATFGPSFQGCNIDIDGNHTCTGKISNAVPIGNAGKQVALYGVAAAENWFEDFGSGQLSNGSAIIHLEPTFAQTVNTGVDYHVFLTPNGDCKGLYVSQKSATSFEVHELGGGTSSIAFDYRITAKRAGFETARLEDKTPNPASRPRQRPAGTHVPNPDDVRKAHMARMAQLSQAPGTNAAARPTSR